LHIRFCEADHIVELTKLVQVHNGILRRSILGPANMATIRCHKCQHDNPAGKGFCLECGTRLAPPPVSPAPAPSSPDTDLNELERLKKLLAASERDVAKLEHAVETAKRDHEAAIAQAEVQAKQDTEAWKTEESRLKEHLTASTQAIADLEKKHSDVATVATQNEQRLQESHATVAVLKQEHEGVIQKLTAGHQDLIAQKDKLLGVLKKDLDDALEKKVIPLSDPPASAVPAKRKFGPMAMSVIATLLTGAGGAGGYYYHGSGENGTPKTVQPAIVSDLQNKLSVSDRLNQELQDRSRALNEAYGRLDQDLKVAQDQLKAQAANPGAGSGDDVKGQLTEAQAANKDLQQKLTATAAELDQRKQQIATQEQSIARMNQELLDVRSQETKPRETKSQEPKEPKESKESKPRARRASDFESTIRNLEREYGRDIGIPWYAR
jgi:DNA repair exonuclease SbcCD ATPase subunit